MSVNFSGVKRGRIRRKSICTNHPELETTYASGPLAGPINRQFSSNNTPSSTTSSHSNTSFSIQTIQTSDYGPTVRKRTNKPKRKNSFRWSLNSTIFEKYF